MADVKITSEKKLRAAFWFTYPRMIRRPGWSQNDYPADVRMLWVDFVDSMARDGEITEKLASRVTLA